MNDNARTAKDRVRFIQFAAASTIEALDNGASDGARSNLEKIVEEAQLALRDLKERGQ